MRRLQYRDLFLTVQLVVLLLASFACSNTADVVKKQTAVNDNFIISGARVFDGKKIITDVDVLVRDGKIAGIGKSLDSRSSKVIDARGHTLVPGFIDAHTHTESVEQLQQALGFGVTTVLDMGTFPQHDSMLRQAAASRRDVADFFSSGIAITRAGGHFTEYGIDVPTLDNVANAEAFVEERYRLGADYIKIMINGVRHEKQDVPILSPETVHAVVRAAHARGLLVWAHVESGKDVRLAVEARVDGLVHYWRDSGSEPALAKLLADSGIEVVSGDLTVIDGFINVGPKLILEDRHLAPKLSENSRKQLGKFLRAPDSLTMEKSFAAFRSLIDANVVLLAGTDAFNGNPRIVHGASYHRMLELYVAAGLTPLQTLQSATASIADTFGLHDRGKIEVGRRADLVLLDGDPTSEIRETRKILRVWREGKEFTSY